MKVETTWKIDKSELMDYEFNQKNWVKDHFSVTDDGKYGIYLYNIEEYRHGAYSALFAIFENSNNPKKILNSWNTRIWFSNDLTYKYHSKSSAISFVFPAYNSNPIKGEYPYLIINFESSEFTLIEFDHLSISHRLVEIGKGKLRLEEIYDRNKNLWKKIKAKLVRFEFDKLVWHKTSDLGRAGDIYRR